MPYSKINEYGIAFAGLPDHLEGDIDEKPRKPALYGSAQRRQLWKCRKSWSFAKISSGDHSSNSLSDCSLRCPSTSSRSLSSNPIASNSLSSSLSTSSSSLGSTSLSSNPANSDSAISNPIYFNASPIRPSASKTLAHTLSSNSVYSSLPLCDPSTSIFSNPAPCSSSISNSLSSPSSSDSGASNLVDSGSHIRKSSPATLASLHDLHKSKVIRVPKDMSFGVMTKRGNDIFAVAVITDRMEVHGQRVRAGNVVIEIRRIIKPGLLPFSPRPFDLDEPVVAGAFYEWPMNRLALLQTQ